MKICVVTDDNSGFSKKEADELGIKIIRMPIIINGEVYFENENLTQEQFFETLERDDCNAKTSQPSPGEVAYIWNEILESYDAIIHIPMSSGLSQSCASAKSISEDYKDKVFVVDNRRISVTLKASVYDAINLINLGKNPAEVQRILENSGKDSVIYIMVDTLKYLKRGGRVTAAGAALGATFHIKPVLTIKGGKLDAYAKCTGVKKSKATMLQAIENDLNTLFKDVDRKDLDFAISYTYDLEEAKIRKSEVESHFHVENILMDPLSLSIASHIGPGALAITVSKRYR